LEVEKERPARAAESQKEEALGPDGRRARDERVRADVLRAARRLGLFVKDDRRR